MTRCLWWSLEQPYWNAVPAPFLLLSAFGVNGFANCGVSFMEPERQMWSKAGLGRCLESWWNWDWADERIDKKTQRFGRWQLRGYPGLQLLLFWYFAKENNHTKEYSVICKLNEDTEDNRGDPREAFLPPHPKHTVLPLKKEEIMEKGWVWGQEWGRGNLSTSFWKRGKKSKISGAQVCLFVCFSKKILQKLCF